MGEPCRSRSFCSPSSKRCSTMTSKSGGSTQQLHPGRAGRTRAYRLAALLLGSGLLHMVTPARFDSLIPQEFPGSPRAYTPSRRGVSKSQPRRCSSTRGRAARIDCRRPSDRGLSRERQYGAPVEGPVRVGADRGTCPPATAGPAGHDRLARISAARDVTERQHDQVLGRVESLTRMTIDTAASVARRLSHPDRPR